ncbi:RteC domain-containing protein [Formosa maritima]|nr:RteC domain-containing protein [Formosa maritima]
MNKINHLVDEYKNQINRYQPESLKEISNLKFLINLSSEYLHQLRLSIRQRGFLSKEDEIHFFKNIKPLVNGHLKYFSHVHYYLMNRPKISASRQRKYIHIILDKFEAQKTREIDFVKYYRHNATRLDHIYFVRGMHTIAITKTIYHFIDPEFSTTHDDNMAKIVAYDLLMTYYKKELLYLKTLKLPLINESSSLKTQSLKWTASKTDLVELIYAMYAIGAIENGNIDLKSLAKICETLFDIELGNFYKTYGEIRAREKDRTKFLDNLRLSLLRKMDKDDD